MPKSRAIKGIDEDLRLNKALWHMAEVLRTRLRNKGSALPHHYDQQSNHTRETWAGRRCYACQVLAETPNKFRVKILAADGVTLPRRRHVAYGQIVSVPEHALQDIPAK
jgi:hypothetical protein